MTSPLAPCSGCRRPRIECTCLLVVPPPSWLPGTISVDPVARAAAIDDAVRVWQTLAIRDGRDVFEVVSLGGAA